MSQYDSSRIGRARREAIRALDDYDATPLEQRGAFGMCSESTFSRYADGVRYQRRPTHPPGRPITIKRKVAGKIKLVKVSAMPVEDALEIATLALLRSSSKFTVKEIVEALHSSRSAVYRQRKAHDERLGDPSPTEDRWFHRHKPSHLTDYLSPPEKRRDAVRRRRRWVTRPRRMTG